jgi:cell division septum initiation protein DivIVA
MSRSSFAELPLPARLECYLGVREITSETRGGLADSSCMRERTPHTQGIDERKFNVVRKGYDKREVKTYLEDLEHAFQDIEGHSHRTSQKVVELERDLAAARATEKASLDNAMIAVFDVKDRLLDRAERRANEIKEDAGKQATSLIAEAAANRGREPELEQRASVLEHDLAQSRADGERLRMQLNDAHVSLDHVESTTTLDITSLQAQLKHEQQQNSELRAAAREVEWVRREFEHKLAQAQEKAMYARAELETIKAQLDGLKLASTESTEDKGTVVYEQAGAMADYDFAVASMADLELDEDLSQAI